MSWNNYHRLDSIYSWMDSMSSRFPDKVKVHVIGRTHEGREIRVVRIGKRNRRKRQSGSKPAIFIEGGIHAREWISPATETSSTCSTSSYFLSQTLTATSTLTQWTGCGGKTEIQIHRHLVSALAWILTGTSATNGDMR